MYSLKTKDTKMYNTEQESVEKIEMSMKKI